MNLLTLIVVLTLASSGVSAAADHPPAAPTENPLRTADDATRAEALTDAWETYQRACRPCHGSVGNADGPFASTFAVPAANLRRPSRAIADDATRFRRIRDGAATRSDRPWESAMPAFGDDLPEKQIWGLVLLLEQLGQENTGIPTDTPSPDVYQARCAVCHGRDGKGDGPLATELTPPPRDLVGAAYHLRSTVWGAPPLDTDIIGGIARGMGDTAMGHFTPLGVQVLQDLGAYLETLAPDAFKAERKVIPSSLMPMESADRLFARGRQVYDDAHCADCHGKARRGDGASARNLKGEAGQPAFATNLTKRSQIRSGGGASDLFRTISGGMNGTAMPAYLDTLTGDERWALAIFLERQMHARPRFPVTLHAGTVSDALPTDPDSPVWSTILSTSVPLGPQVEVAPYWTQPSIDELEVAVAVKDNQVAILLSWDDRTRDVQTDDAGEHDVVTTIARRGSWRLPDRIAVQFPEKLDPKGTLPPPYLGDAARPVGRWIWSADRTERGDATAIVDRVAGPHAAPSAGAGAATVKSAASFADGRWRVVLTGDLPPKTPATIPIAFQAWDGAAGETGQRQSFSGWLTLSLR